MHAWLAVACVAYLLWNLCIVTVETRHGPCLHGVSTSNIVAQFVHTYGVPRHLCQLWKHMGHRRLPVAALTRGRHSIGARPVSGDHIHMAMSIWIGTTPRPAEHDRPYEQDIHYETFPPICTYKGDVAYTKLWPHAGVHTHCDGLIHVHPWSAPRALRKEGLDVTLGLWFDQVGIEYRPDGLEFNGTGPLHNNATHKWRLAEYKCAYDTQPTIYDSQLDGVWLGHAYASYVLWYDTSPTPPPMIREHVETLLQWGATGYDGNPYPQQCIQDKNV